ncbi:MAG: FAD-binding oxidoreductase [Acidobacteriia bacterium]|nr:FAD-binding oxidoreductase [Terriglobia bacterium]
MTLSLWLDTRHVPRPRLEGNQTADAVILGAGMTGIGLAYFLAEQRLETVVVEGETVAGGATGRNLGLLVSGLGEHYARSVAFWGRNQAAAIMRLHLENHGILASLADRHGIECGYRRSGSYAVGIDSEEEEELRRSSLLLREDGFECAFLEAADMNRALGGRGFCGGIHNPLDGVVDPVRLIRGLARQAEKAGGRILERSPIRSVDRAGTGWIVRSPHGSLSAPLLFLACNAWLPQIYGRVTVKPVRGQCCALAAPSAVLPDIACIANYGAEYWRRAGEHGIFGGFRRLGSSAEEGYQDSVSDVIQSALQRFVRAHFPGLDHAPVTHRWSGVMAFTPDGLPIVGGIPGEDGLYVAGGYTGHGFGYAFLAARWLTALTVERRDEISPLCRIDRPMRSSPALTEI